MYGVRTSVADSEFRVRPTRRESSANQEVRSDFPCVRRDFSFKPTGGTRGRILIGGVVVRD